MSRLSANAKVEDEAVVKKRSQRSIFSDVVGFLAIVSTLTTGSKYGQSAFIFSFFVVINFWVFIYQPPKNKLLQPSSETK